MQKRHNNQLVWRCPKCRRWLPQRNAVHVCRPPVPLGEHFRGKSPQVRELYQALRNAVRKIGPVHLDSTQTRIAFAVETIFLELTPQASGLRGCLMLPRRMSHRLFERVLSLSPRIHYHYFKLTAAKQLDDRFRRLLAEGYKFGRREHLRQPLRAPRELPAAFVKSPREPRIAGHQSRPLWRCPKCGRWFVTRNLWHSCARISVDSHFRGKNPKLRQAFHALVKALRRHGPLFVNANKTRITFQARMRFAGIVVQKESLLAGLTLTRRVHDLRFLRVVSFGPRAYFHQFRLTEAKQIDRRLRTYLAEAYRVGCQEHLRNHR